jgi:hypothetical protein
MHVAISMRDENGGDARISAVCDAMYEIPQGDAPDATSAVTQSNRYRVVKRFSACPEIMQMVSNASEQRRLLGQSPPASRHR